MQMIMEQEIPSPNSSSRLLKGLSQPSLITGRGAYQNDSESLPERHGVPGDHETVHGGSESSGPFRHPQTIRLLGTYSIHNYSISKYTQVLKKNLFIQRSG